MFLSLWVSFECTFVGEWKERVLLCVCEWVHPLCESRSWGTEELQRTAQLWQAGFSFIVRRLERFASVPAPLIRILGCDSQFSILRFSPLSAARFSSLDSPIRIVLALQFAVLQLQRCRRRCLRSCVLVTSSSISVFVVCLLLTLVAVCEFFIYFPHTHTSTHLPYASSSPPNNKN